jgi:hypothetical protein
MLIRFLIPFLFLFSVEARDGHAILESCKNVKYLAPEDKKGWPAARFARQARNRKTFNALSF